MKDTTAVVTALLMVLFAFRYVFQIWKRSINPALSTWIIFLAGTGLSLATYVIAENHDIVSGVLNTADVLVVLSISLAIIARNGWKLKFSRFEKFFLCAIAAAVVYGIISGNAWNSNLFTQALITSAYIPTLRKMYSLKKNTESFSGWGLNFAAATVALYPSLVDGNMLAVIYAIRTQICAIVIMSFMFYYSKRR